MVIPVRKCVGPGGALIEPHWTPGKAEGTDGCPVSHVNPLCTGASVHSTIMTKSSWIWGNCVLSPPTGNSGPEMAPAFLLLTWNLTGKECFPLRYTGSITLPEAVPCFLAQECSWEQQMTIKHSGALTGMRSVGQNSLCCHFHHIKLWACHLVCLSPMLILSVKGEASGSSSSSCLVAVAGKHSAHQQYHTPLTLLNTQWGICRLSLEEIGSTELYHAKRRLCPQR